MFKPLLTSCAAACILLIVTTMLDASLKQKSNSITIAISPRLPCIISQFQKSKELPLMGWNNQRPYLLLRLLHTRTSSPRQKKPWQIERNKGGSKNLDPKVREDDIVVGAKRRFWAADGHRSRSSIRFPIQSYCLPCTLEEHKKVMLDRL